MALVLVRMGGERRFASLLLIANRKIEGIKLLCYSENSESSRSKRELTHNFPHYPHDKHLWQ